MDYEVGRLDCAELTIQRGYPYFGVVDRPNCCLPNASASPKKLADVHSASLRFFAVCRSVRPRRTTNADSSESKINARRHIRRNRSGRVHSRLRKEGASSAGMA